MILGVFTHFPVNAAKRFFEEEPRTPAAGGGFCQLPLRHQVAGRTAVVGLAVVGSLMFLQ